MRKTVMGSAAPARVFQALHTEPERVVHRTAAIEVSRV